MKRRGFIGALFGLAAAPVVANVLLKEEKEQLYIDGTPCVPGNAKLNIDNSDGGYLLPPDITRDIVEIVHRKGCVSAKPLKVKMPKSDEFANFLRQVKAANK